jgi:3'(2'), 5'-bisphosphate nucleotidase
MTNPAAIKLDEIVALAKKAGDEIMKIYESGESGATSKADSSPLTLADIASHETILEGLHDIAPVMPVLSEEAADISFDERKKWPVYWLVDPLDGTKEFIKRNGEFTVNIALVENGAPVLGVVYAPVLKACYFAALGQGAYLQQNGAAPRQISVHNRLSGTPVRVVASRSHSDERTTALLKCIGAHEIVSMGSSLKFCLVAEGRADCYPRLGPTMEWDTAAAHAIVNEAGGIVCKSDGRELLYNKQDLHNPEFYVYARHDLAMRKLLNMEMPA